MSRSAPASPSTLADAERAAEQFRVIAELRGDIAFIIDCRTGQPTYVSETSRTMLGYDMDDFLAQMNGEGDASHGALGDLCGGLNQRLQRFVSGDDSRRKVVRRLQQRCPNGALVPIEVVSTILVGADG